MSKQDSIVPTVPRPGGWYEGFQNASEDAIFAAGLKMLTAAYQYQNPVLAPAL